MGLGLAVDRTVVVGWPLAADKAVVVVVVVVVVDVETLAAGRLALPVVDTVAVELRVQAFESG